MTTDVIVATVAVALALGAHLGCAAADALAVRRDAAVAGAIGRLILEWRLFGIELHWPKNATIPDV